MWTDSTTSNRSGRLVPTIRGQMAFVPNDLPLQVQWTSELISTLSDAERAVGQLRGVGLNLPNPNLLIRPFVRREAVLSSRIEGTQAELRDLYLFDEIREHKTKPAVPDVQEVANYVRALEYGIRRCSELPVCLRLIRELHEILMHNVRGHQSIPGQFRSEQNWIGPQDCPIEQASYVPPPPEQMKAALDAFERFINSPLQHVTVLVWLAMVHYQFEAIHPFRDGNGRIGRLLITLLLCAKNILDKPLLYLSAYFERNRREYYKHLLRVSTHGEWVEWILFFLRGVTEQSIDAFERSRQLMALQQEYREMVGSQSWSALRLKLVDFLVEQPIVTIVTVRKHFDISYPAAANNIAALVKVGILKEITGSKRNRIYMAQKVWEIINRPSATTEVNNTKQL